ncbi:hypothetical protein [Paraliomyxa miuraensis]|uniref:hypothetical protein n=1 Tax=Paraliomyxa miuraensis TaxID=376150 RepID=UPI0022562891|nr:hypothetical protein [Paraliomyxa miuraensis]MCX4247996.1 hypothetical protein [Paraliomyxa miuraensis]
MRRCSWVVGAWAGLVVLACEREPPTEATPAPRVEAQPEEREPADTDAESPRRRRAWTPWGRAAEAEEEARRAMEEAQAEAQREMEELERTLEERQREAELLERELTERLAPSLPAEGGPLPEGPLAASRPEPEARAVPIPPFAHTVRAEAPVPRQGPRPRLEQRSAKRNAIIDTDAWFFAHGLSLPTWELPSAGGALPPQIPENYRGHSIVEAIRGDGHSIAIYSDRFGVGSRQVVVFDDAGDSLGALDFSAWPHQQEVHWAGLHEGVLFVCTYHMTYASSTGGLNAFITALELRSGELLWQSEPLVCNVQDFLLRDGWIITGYGFTAEPDFLFVLDMKTGEVVEKQKIKSGPEVILEKGGELYVRTYDHDYVFGVR